MVKKNTYSTMQKKKILQNVIKFTLCWPSTAQQWSLPLSVVCIPSEILWRKLSFKNSYQLKTASGLQMGACVHFISQTWGSGSHL